MSQRVQKGSTIFRPVARPRARPGAESHQSSVLPEATPSVLSGRLQDNVAHQAAPMLVPQVIHHNPPIEPDHAHSAAATLQDRPSLSRETPTPQPFPTSVHASSVTVATPAARNSSRMPPIIGSSQRISSHNALTVPLASSHTPCSPPSGGSVPSVPQAVPSLPRFLEHGPHPEFDDYRALPPPLPEHLSAVHFPFGSHQIDPQLMDASGLGPQGVLLPGTSLERRPMSTDDAPVVKRSRRRRSSRKRFEADVSGAGTNGDPNLQDGASTTRSKRRRSKKKAAEGNEDMAEPQTKKRRLAESDLKSDRARPRQPSLPPFDLEADPGEELDPTVVTMAALCDDSGRGRVSTRAAQIVNNHAAWRTSNREKRARMKAAMEAKKYGRNLDEEEESATRVASNSQPGESTELVHPGSASRSGIPTANRDMTRQVDGTGADGFDYTENLAVSRYNVQVRIGANGETIIDEDSLFVNRDEEHHTEYYTHVEESDFSKFVNSSTYSKKARGSRWSAEETELFFDALSQFGENYELISYVLPGRDRKACKNKFKAEDKRNPARITFCLTNRNPYDIATLTRMTGKDFSGPTPEIRLPTPARSTELQTDEPTHVSPRAVREKSRTPSVHDADVEIVGGIDDFDKDDVDIDT